MIRAYVHEREGRILRISMHENDVEFLREASIAMDGLRMGDKVRLIQSCAGGESVEWVASQMLVDYQHSPFILRVSQP